MYSQFMMHGQKNINWYYSTLNGAFNRVQW